MPLNKETAVYWKWKKLQYEGNGVEWRKAAIRM